MYGPHTKEDFRLFLKDVENCKRLSGKSEYDFRLRRRTLNVVWMITDSLREVPFEELMSNMYFKCSDDMKPILNFYEDCLIDSKLNNDQFRLKLHDRLLVFRDKIKAEHKQCILVEFFNILTQACIRKDYSKPIIKKIFSAYLSLVQQSITYFYDDIHKYFYAVKEDGTFLTIDDPWPMIDWAHEEYADKTFKSIVEGKEIDTKKLLEETKKRYAKYGMIVHDVEDMMQISTISNNFGNVTASMAYYMSEQTKDMLPQNEVGLKIESNPKKWLNTEYYKERLLKRNFALPGCIKTTCEFAGDIKEVYFREVIKDDNVVMLYRVVTKTRGEYSDIPGYYIPNEKFMFLYYNVAEGAREESSIIENFILELYFLLTVRRTEEEKQMKPYSLPLIAEEYEDVYKEPRWKNQPIISFSLYGREEKKGREQKRAYKQGIYEYDDAKIGCFIRRLPVGQTASWEAITNATKYGYELEKGYTFVTPFARKQRHIKVLGGL